MKTTVYVIIILSIFLSCNGIDNKQSEEKLISYVNVFVGTDGPGNTYPGVTLPFGMVQLSPDNGLGGWDRIAGYYWQDSTIAGFSHKHLTGTGAGDLYDILVMPLNSRFSEDLWPKQIDYRPYSKFNHDKEKAHPGYYAVDLLSSVIKAELTATQRVGFHRYTFPADDSSKILIDLGYALNWDSPTDTYLEIQDNNTIIGYRKSTGWAKDQREYFVAKFSKPIEKVDLFENNQVIQNTHAKAQKTKAMLHFKTTDNEQVLIKLALSSTSIEGAQKNLESELPGWDFDKAVADAEETWEKQLACIKIKGTDYQKEVFYTNLYHCFLTPSLHSDVDGKLKAADGTIKQAIGYKRYDTFSLWDTYRTAHPLYTLVCPDNVSDFIASFLGHYDETGLLPVWSMAGNETNMMIGYHAVPVIVDAYFKGIKMDVEKAYEACKQTAKSNAWDLEEYKKYGYVPADGKNKGHWSVSKTLEYAYDDWCIAQFAKALNKEEDYQYFTLRSTNWEKLYDKSSTFFRPRNKNGKFISNFIPKEYTEYFCESNAWQYFWAIPQDIDSLVNMLGKKAFTAKLDSMFNYYPLADDKLPIFSTGMIGQYAHGNEPSHHVAYLFNYIDKPWRTQELVNQIITTQYSNKPNGYCGNEDCGQMSAWLVCSAMGIYPVNPANGIYDLTSPWVESAEIQLPEGKKFTIKTVNHSDENIYIQEILLNGKSYNKLSISHQQIMAGGDLVFILGKKPYE
ncbi:MAG: GH92 family glycosyl hydrolase [Bacteroidales bacterium]|nr:GH92 family glycosyl hydrolase [Bacteroidales bacterium]